MYSMSITQLAILAYIIGMMAVDFVILYYVLRRPLVSRRAIFFASSIFIFMAVEAVDISLIIFNNFPIFIEPITLLIVSIPLFLSIKVKDKLLPFREDKVASLVLSLTIVFDELAMGFAYAQAFGPHINPILASVSNIAFGVMMLADAIFFLLISPIKNLKEISLFTFASSMAFMPNIFLQFSLHYQLIASLIASVIMIVNILALYLIQQRQLTINSQLLAISLALFDFIMMLGLTTYAVVKDLYLISISMILSMIWYFILVTYKFNDVKFSPKLRHVLGFVSLVNLAELTMAFGESVLGFKATLPEMSMHMWNTGPFWWIFPTDPWAMTVMAFHQAMMNSHNLLFSVFWASYMLIMMTTMLPFYVIMMGSEMAFLVYERFKKVNKVKSWTLAIIVGIPIFVLILPYYTPAYVFGMSGMLAHINPALSVTLLSFVISIVAVIIASTLFGRRAYCNLVCMAAHMWTNVYYDQFKPKKSSKVWEYVRWIMLGVMFIIFAYVILIFLGLAKNPSIGKLQIPLLDFYGMFVLNYVWWFFFFLTPVFGAYSCARQGWCGFGTFTGLFNKVLFRIKAKSVDTCRECNTIDCEKSCPVSIEIRKDILAKGYSNRISCVGCGDCVEACPYDNLSIGRR
ncbi:MAG: 4Fe-4S binding protein [Sulfolobaceae archaeon]